jgi:hypothetical protein
MQPLEGEILPPVRLEGQLEPFRSTPTRVLVTERWSIDELVGHLVETGKLHPALITCCRVYVGDVLIPYEAWERVRPRSGAVVYVKVIPQGGGGGGGGKSPLRIVAALALMVVAFYAGAVLGPLMMSSMGFTASATAFTVGTTAITYGAIGTAIVGGLVSIVGNALINALIPTPSSSMSGGGFAATPLSPPNLSITGAQNKANPYGPVPRLFGKRQLFPPLAAKAYTHAEGNDQYLRMVFTCGYGPLQLENICIGLTPITAFADVEYEVRQGYEADEPLTLYTQSVNEDSLSILLKQSGGTAMRTSQPNSSELSVDLTFERGLTHFLPSGGRDSVSVDVLIEYRPVGGSTWTAATTLTTKDNSTSAVRNNYQWTVDKGQYDVRLSRVTADSTDSAIVDMVTWSALRSVTPEHPIEMKGIALIAVYIKANDQLNGVIQQLNCVATSMHPVWDGASWSEPQATCNPAWHFCDVLRGKANKRPILDSRLDLERLLAWALACDTVAPQGTGPTWTYNAVHDQKSTVFEMLKQIASAGRAAFTMRDGKYSVVRDVPQVVPRQHLTPRNSWGFKSTKVFVTLPHALRCRFINPEVNWQLDERIVYVDGYDETTATLFEQLDMLFYTDSDMVWREGRYHLAVAQLRPEVYELSVDAEALVSGQGDLVYAVHDVPQWGVGSARVVDLLVGEAGSLAAVVLDDLMVMDKAQRYALRARLADGTSLLLPVAEGDGYVDTLELLEPLPAGHPGPQVGDLLQFGLLNVESAPLVVQSLVRANELAATLKFVDASPEIHDSYTGVIPKFNTRQTVTRLPQFTPPATPVLSQVTDTVLKVGGKLVERLLVTLSPGRPGEVATARLQLQYQVPGAPAWRSVFHDPSQPVFELDDVVVGQNYNLRARAFSEHSTSSDWVTANYTPLGLNSNPLDVTGLSLQVLGSTLTASWTQTAEVDVDRAEVRFSPTLSPVAWENMVPIGANGGKVQQPLTSVVLPAMSGTYAVKWVDIGGRYSTNAEMAVTSVPALTTFTLLTVIESPTFSGTKTNCSVVAGELRLIDQTQVGIYEFASYFDLTAVGTARLMASLGAYGLAATDVVDNWGNVDAVPNWDGMPQTGWNLTLEVSTTQDDPAGGPTWSPWQALVAGDYTARAFKWRLVLSGNGEVGPSVQQLEVDVSALNRTEETVGTTTSAGGLATVTYARAFKLAPSVGITAHDLQTGDYFTFTAKSTTGFSVQFYNSAGAGVQRTFDSLSSGFGAVS